jgi:hypothetical protein
MTSSFTLTLDNHAPITGTLELPTVRRIPQTGVYGFLLHDFQTAFYKFKPRGLTSGTDHLDDDKGWPQMVPGAPRLGVKLTEPLQWYWCKQLVLSKFKIHIDPTRASFEARLNTAQRDYIKKAWRGLTRDDTAFTNHSGTWNKKTGLNTGADYITRQGLSLQPPKLWENGCGGTVVELVSRTPDGRGYYRAKTLKVSDFSVWSGWTFLDHPERFVIATNATPYLVGTKDTFTRVGPWRVNGMHFIDPADVVVPLMSESGYLDFRADRVRVLEPGSVWPEPYVG